MGRSVSQLPVSPFISRDQHYKLALVRRHQDGRGRLASTPPLLRSGSPPRRPLLRGRRGPPRPAPGAQEVGPSKSRTLAVQSGANSAAADVTLTWSQRTLGPVNCPLGAPTGARRKSWKGLPDVLGATTLVSQTVHPRGRWRALMGPAGHTRLHLHRDISAKRGRAFAGSRNLRVSHALDRRPALGRLRR